MPTLHHFLTQLKSRAWNDNALLAWLRDTRHMRKFVQGMDIAPSGTGSQRQIGVVLTPWSGSAVPWFSLAFGLLLGARGHDITFILDDMPFGPAGKRWKLELACIRSVLKRIRGRCRVVQLSNHREGALAPQIEADALGRLAHLNMVWAMRGESNIPPTSVQAASEQLKAVDGPIGRLLQAQQFDVLFVPGGVWGSSGVWIRHAQANGIRVASYDSGGYGVLLLAVNGIACQLQDIPHAFALLKAHAVSATDRALIVDAAKTEIEKRRAGKDKFASQLQAVNPKDPRFDGAVLIALNSSWDSAALGLHTVFQSTQEWIVETVRYILASTQSPVIVRQHPVERLAIARSNDDYRKLLHEHFGNEPRLHFVAAEDPVNSYDLLEQVSAVVVYTSTVGVEAAAQGKVVITESSSYYADLGFVRKGCTTDEYFQLLADATSGKEMMTQAMVDDALACYYITQCCNWVQTPFNVPDFPKWSRRPAADLTQNQSVRSVLEAVESGTPVAFLNHLRRLARTSQERLHHA